MTATAYEPVVPTHHDETCRRKPNPTILDTEGHGLDREGCERCEALWQRLVDVAAARLARAES